MGHYVPHFTIDEDGLPPNGPIPWVDGGKFPARLWENGRDWDWAYNYLTPNSAQPHNIWEREFIANILKATGTNLQGLNIASSRTWSGTIYLIGDVIIPNGVTLTIEPGTTINFRPDTDVYEAGDDNAKAEIIIQNGGALSAVASVSAPIVLQSSFNVDAGTPNPTDDDWVGIRVEEGGTLTLQNCVIRDAEVGVDVTTNPNVQVTTSVEIRETDFLENYKGIKLDIGEDPLEITLTNIGLNRNLDGIETFTNSSEPPGPNEIEAINWTASDNDKGFVLKSMGSNNQKFTIKNTILSYNTIGASAEYSGTPDITFRYSDFYLNSTATFSGDISGLAAPPGSGNHVGNLGNDPIFVQNEQDYHLQTASPLLNAGDPTMTDPDGSFINMGRYGGTSEYTQSPSSLPSPYVGTDVGSVGVTGSATYSGGTFTVKGSGVDIWDYDDGFQYVCQPFSGNGWISAKIVSMDNTNEWAKVGVMIRESLATDAPHAMMVLTPGHGAIIQGRQTSGGSSIHPATTSGGTPRWVKIERSGSTFIGSVSNNSGASWNVVGSMSASMGSNVLIGLCVTAHNNSVLNTTTFDNVNISTSGGGGGGITNGNFSNGLNGWTATGSWVINGAWTTANGYTQPGQIGDFAGSYPEEWSTGTLTSATFTINKPYLNFRIGGQDNANANTVRLIVGGNVVKQTYPPHDNGFIDISWSVSNWSTESAYIECIDGNSNGGYAWFCVDEFGLSDSPSTSPSKPVVFNQDTPAFRSDLPDTFTLAQNTPNPFNPATTIAYALPRASDVSLKIYNVLGQEIRTLVNSINPAGFHRIVWDSQDDLGRQVSSGIYFYRIVAGPMDETRKMLILK